MISSWLGNMSAYLRAIDPNHLISIGEEGYWGAYSPDIVWNPNAGTNGGGWVPLSGQNFTNQSANPHIDFAVRACYQCAAAFAHGMLIRLASAVLACRRQH